MAENNKIDALLEIQIEDTRLYITRQLETMGEEAIADVRAIFTLISKLYYIVLIGRNTKLNDNFLKQLQNEVYTLFNKYPESGTIHSIFFDILWFLPCKTLLKLGQYYDCENIFKESLKIVEEWEEERRRNKNYPKEPPHKGTGYYYWSVSCFKRGDLDKAFLCMHRAYEEDKLRYNLCDAKHPGFIENSPAYQFVTLSTRAYINLLTEIVRVETLLDHRLKAYADNYKLYSEKKDSTLDLEKLHTFLKSTYPIYDLSTPKKETAERRMSIIFYFVYEMYRIQKMLEDAHKSLGKSHFSTLLEIDVLFGLCRLLEVMLKERLSKETNDDRLNNLIITFFDEKLRFGSVSSKKQPRSDGIKSKKTKPRLDNINCDKNNGVGIDKILENLLKKENYVCGDGASLCLYIPEKDFIVSYLLRNLGGHNIKEEKFISENFDKLVQCVLNSIFFAIEKLYLLSNKSSN